MKIIIENNKISLEGKRLRLSNISASWEANGVMSSIAGGLADETENAIDIVSKSEKATAVWSMRIFDNAVRIRFNIECENDTEISKIIPFSADMEEDKNLKILKVPFDNDDWVRYSVSNCSECGRSYGVGAVFKSGYAIAIGAVDYSVWKTGIDFNSGITVTAGIADALTRDTCRHGSVLGSAQAPEIWIFEDVSWESAMESFAKKYSAINGRLQWNGKHIRGWNSWYAYMTDIDEGKYKRAADFVSELDNMGGSYINFDAFWTILDAKQLLSCADYVKDKGFIPGIYIAPFATWIEDDRLDMPVTDDMGNVLDEKILWRDILLKDYDGNILPRLDGGLSLDMTHPVSIARMEKALAYLKSLGYKYIKLDFLGHGAREGAFYDISIRTGLQCYNAAMERINKIWSDEDMFLSLSISPVFPGGMGHARRVCCDVFGEIKDSKYLLNSLTYGWWLNGRVYEYNDPDHICFDKGDAEAKFRFVSGLIGGTVFLLSSKIEDETTCLRVQRLTRNAELMSLIDKHITFRPIDEYINEDFAEVFIGQDDGHAYIAAFNFSSDVRKYSIGTEQGTAAIDMFSGETVKYDKTLEFSLSPSDCTIMRI